MTLHDLVERDRRGLAHLTGTTVMAAIVAAVAIAIAGGIFWLGGARWLELPRVVPFAFWILVIGVVTLGYRKGRTIVQQGSRLSDVALAVEEERALRTGSLRGILEVAHSGALGRLGAEKMAERLSSLGAPVLAPRARKRALTRAVVGTAVATVGVFGVVSGASAAPDGWAALLHPVRAWNGTLLDGVSLDGVPTSVLRGERATLTVRAPGRRTVELAQRRTGGPWLRSTLVVRNGVSTVRLDPLDANVVLYATDGRATSDTVTIGVVERPFIGGVTIHASFPAYLDRRDETIPLGEPARVPRGTMLQLDGQSSTELREITLAREGEAVRLVASGRRFSGRLVASTSGRYAWSAVGAAGPIADVPTAIELEVLPDSAPRVEILAPGRDTTATAADTLNLSILATDDHGIGGVLVRSWIVTARGETRGAVTRPIAAPGEAQWSGETPVSMSGLTPGDAMHLVAVAADRSPWKQLGESRELVIRLPSLSEQRDAVRAAADSAVSNATATANAQKQLQQRTADAAKARQPQKAGQNTMSYEAAEQAKQFAKEQRQLADRMQQMQKAARQLEQQLKQTGALDSALQERLREAQKLLRDALTPELQEQLRKLEQASNKLSQEDARKAMQDLSEQQKKLREQLEKSVEMLKRAAIEGQMQTLKDEAKDMAKKQRDLVDSLRKADTDQERSEAQRQAKDLANKAKELSDDVRELQQRLKNEKAESGAERTAEANQKIQESAEQMEQAARAQAGEKSQVQKDAGEQKQGGEKQAGEKQAGEKQGGEKQGGEKQGQQGQAQKGGQPSEKSQQQGGKEGQGQGKSAEDAARQAADAMEEAASQLTKAREQQVSEWKKELTGELDRSIQEMLQLAREQDQLEQQARKGAAAEELRSQQSALQQGVEKAGQRLQDAGKKSSLLSQRSMRMTTDARRKVEDATRQTQAAQTGQQMASAMREASEALNQAAASLVRDRERTQDANSATGFAEMLKQLQQMSQQQSTLNSAVQDLIPRPGSQLDQQGQAQARQLAKQQRDVASQLDDAADRDDSGKAEQMAKEARQIAQALELSQLDPAVLERQQRLFRKMLDAGKLLEEDQREDTGKREAKAWTGSDVFTPPNAAASGRAAIRFQPPAWNELRGLTPEERRLVLEYFKKINAERP
jgi:hypothetical protein